MKLLNLTYTDDHWELRDLSLGGVNLVVGMNGTGKSRTLLCIHYLHTMITQKRPIDQGEQWRLEFENQSGELISYSFATDNGDKGVRFEEIKVGRDTKLLRDMNEGKVVTKLWSETAQAMEEIYPPEDKLVLHVRRDVRSYPFLEDLVAWAENSFGFKFGNINPQTGFTGPKYDLLTSTEAIPGLFKQLTEAGRSAVVETMNELGYPVASVTWQARGEWEVILVEEAGLAEKIHHYSLSQGMFRSLAVIIYIQYLITQQKPATVVIDDLGEGLDFDRATKLSRLIFGQCQQHGIQLIATSNDSFLMEAVDLEHWTVLQREGKVVTALNPRSHPKLFSDFKYTGLSNFDFFSSNYIPTYQAS